MAVITGTALSKNTPVRVLQELECAERREAGQKEQTDVAQLAEEQKEHTKPQIQAQPDSVSRF